MIGRATLLAAALGCAGCVSVTDFGLWIEQPPPPAPELPAPARFSGDAPPALVTTEQPGLLRAPTLSQDLYYYEPIELWYRRWRGRWYQAFTWDGHWFPPAGKVPPAVAAVEPASAPASPAPL